MSANARLLWIIPALLVASWLAVRSLAASPAPTRQDREMGDPPVPFASLAREVRDPALQRYIGDLARRN
jgi:hypothetical protein